MLPYDVLMQELDVTNVRELEDFLINECMYVVSKLFIIPSFPPSASVYNLSMIVMHLFSFVCIS